MSENSFEKKQYTEKDALEESQRMSKIVELSGGKKDFVDAERHLKRFNYEVRPSFNEEDFEEARSIFLEITNWDWENITEDERKNEVRDGLEKLFTKRGAILSAYEYREGLLYFILEIAQGKATGGSESDIELMKKFGLEMISELRLKIVRNLKRDGFGHLEFRALNLLAGSANEEDKKVGLETLSSLLKIITDGIVSKKWDAFRSLGLIFENGDNDQQQEAAEVIIDVSQKIDGTSMFGEIISLLFSDPSSEVAKQGEKIVLNFLEKHKLSRDVFEAWKRSGNQIYEIVERNMTSIGMLEKENPGICSFLYREFGIADFGRYPVELLLSQYREVDKLENPYGVVIFPRDDHNGAFYNDAFALLEFYKKLQGEFSLRVFECDGKIGVARALLKCSKKYNPPGEKGHKISLAIIGGHGSRDSIRFGVGRDRDFLFIDDLMGKGVQKTSEFFEANPTIILVSCSTGADKGIGQKLSEVMGAKVIAPKTPTNISEIQVGKRRGGKFRFNAKYRSEEKDVRSVYVGGVNKGE